MARTPFPFTPLTTLKLPFLFPFPALATAPLRLLLITLLASSFSHSHPRTSFITGVSAHPNPLGLGKRAAADNTVVVRGTEDYCLIVPRFPYTNIGDSEQPGGTQSYCTPAAHYSADQGEMPGGFWTNVEFAFGDGEGDGGRGRWAQLTGCIDPSTLDRLNVNDDGGQYDSSGGSEGTGNPVGSVCTGYNHYVELIEPAGPRACIKCCDEEEDCPTSLDTAGCPDVIPGNYFDCA